MSREVEKKMQDFILRQMKKGRTTTLPVSNSLPEVKIKKIASEDNKEMKKLIGSTFIDQIKRLESMQVEEQKM